MANTQKSGKRPYRMKWTMDIASETMLCRPYDTDEKPIGDFSVHVDLKKLSANNRHYAMFHGVKQNIADEAAQSAGATLKQKFDAMRERAEYLESGNDEWSSRKTGEGTLLFRALMEENPKRDAEKTRGIVEKMNEKERRALMNSDRLSAIVDRLRGPSNVDTDKLFDELDAE